MIRLSHPLLLASIMGTAIAAPKKDAEKWAVSGAPYRVTLHADSAPDIPEAGWEIRLPDFGAGRPDMRDVVLLDQNGKEIALDPVWRGTGRSLLLLAESMPAEGAPATLFFGGGSSLRMKTWSAKRSLLLETRRMPAGANPTTYTGWQEAWKKAPSVDGAAFVSQIFHGNNPFGESSRFLSRYTGQLKSKDGGELKFYTLSDDVSYVTMDGRPVLKWQKNQPPPLDPRKVPVAAARLAKDSTPVDYCHAAIDPPGAMVLGWERDGKLGTIPPEAWVHPGRTKPGTFETADGSPVPLPDVVPERYLGHGGEWHVSVKARVDLTLPEWEAEWIWPDGRVDRGAEVRRWLPGLDPVRVVLRLRNGQRTCEGRRSVSIPVDLPAASVNNRAQLDDFLGLLAREDPAKLPEPARKAGFVLARDFLPAGTAATWAEAWLAVAQPAAGPWTAAITLAVRETAKRDPKAALAHLTGLPSPARAALGGTADLLELDLRVFYLKDPVTTALAARLGKSGDRNLARMAKIRLGDYYLLMGRTDDAVKCFTEAVPDQQEAERKAPVIDRAHSLAIEELINAKHPDEARAKLDAWERQRPMARLEGDQLLWRARVMFLGEEWQRALLDLETSLKLRPGSPEEIDVRFWQGRALYELGRKDEARKIWKTLIEDYPKHERAEAAKQWSEKS
jgi:tetratricopeptide (TPR) repeat protein